MKTFGLSLIVLGLAIAAVPASAQTDGQTAITLETHTEGGAGYFSLEGQTARNPTLNAAPGQEITVTIEGTDVGVHNFCVDISGESTCSEYVQAPGDTQTVSFTAPASGSVEYYCLPHRGSGMKGTMNFGAASATTPATTTTDGGEGGNDTPGLSLVGVGLAVAGAAFLVARRK